VNPCQKYLAIKGNLNSPGRRRYILLHSSDKPEGCSKPDTDAEILTFLSALYISLIPGIFSTISLFDEFYTICWINMA
jgi:hypothetical protein